MVRKIGSRGRSKKRFSSLPPSTCDNSHTQFRVQTRTCSQSLPSRYIFCISLCARQSIIGPVFLAIIEAIILIKNPLFCSILTLSTPGVPFRLSSCS